MNLLNIIFCLFSPISFFSFHSISIMSSLNPNAADFVPGSFPTSLKGTGSTTGINYTGAGNYNGFTSVPKNKGLIDKRNTTKGNWGSHTSEHTSSSHFSYFPTHTLSRTASLPHRESHQEVSAPSRVLLVTGYRMSGKTSVAQKIAEAFNFAYVNLAGKKTSSMCVDHVQRFSPLTNRINDLRGKNGIVIDDGVMSRFDPLYINFLLRKKNLCINQVIYIESELSDVLKRMDENELDKHTHPENLEFSMSVEAENHGISCLIVLNGKLPLPELVEEAEKEVREYLKSDEVPLNLPAIHFIPGAPMVEDPALVEKVILAESNTLSLSATSCGDYYSFPYVLPSFYLDYALFAKSALLLENYLIIPWIYSQKVSIIGYENSVYVHLPFYQMLFLLDDVAPGLKELCQRCSEVASIPKTGDPALKDSPVSFSLDAVMKDDKIYISDMMYLAKELGSKKSLRDRVQLMNTYLGNLDDDCIHLMKYYTVNDIDKCIDDYKDITCGVSFVNPDVLAPSEYDNRNFVYYFSEKKSLPLRLWGGTAVKEFWEFQVYGLNEGKDMLIQNVKVIIPNSVVEEKCINDGQIVECTPMNVEPPKGQKDKKSRNLYSFVSRCKWTIEPVTVYFHQTIMKKNYSEIYLKACKNIKCEGL